MLFLGEGEWDALSTALTLPHPIPNLRNVGEITEGATLGQMVRKEFASLPVPRHATDAPCGLLLPPLSKRQVEGWPGDAQNHRRPLDALE